MRRFLLAVALCAGWCPCSLSLAAGRDAIIPVQTAERHGLTRAWFTQIRMDRTQGRIVDVVLHEGILYVQTSRAMLHVIDAETGETIWAKQVGRPEHPSLTPAVGEDLVAVLNGSRLYVCNRHNGNLLLDLLLDEAPGAGACLSDERVYVPMVTGRVVAYELDRLRGGTLSSTGDQNAMAEETAVVGPEVDARLRLRTDYIPRQICHSPGRALVQPLVTRDAPGEEYVAWPTDLGYMNIAWIDLDNEGRLAVRYRLQTAAAITARPTYLPPDPNDPISSGVIFATSGDGFVHAILERNGESSWRFAAGEPIIEPAVVIGERVYVATQLGGLFCLEATTGESIWWTPRVYRFVAASNQRVYVTDKIGRILVLSAHTGARLDTIATDHLPLKLVNSDTDRLYLGTDTGLIQCLHEVELSEPIRHSEALRKRAGPEQPEGQQQGPSEQPGDLESEDDNPFARGL